MNHLRRFSWVAHSQGSPDSYGEPADVAAAPVSVWGRFDSLSSSRQTYLESLVNTQVGLIALRQWLNVNTGDVLTDTRFSEDWEVLSVHRDTQNYETVCEVRKRG